MKWSGGISMQVTFTKTTILLMCTVLGLTIGISSAFGQKLVDQSPVKGEIPIDQPNFNRKKELVPEHLKPNQPEEPKESKETSPPPVKGERPIDMPKNFNHSERLVPETNPSATENQPSEQLKEPDTKTDPPKQEKPKEPPNESGAPNNENPPDQKKEEPSSEKITNDSQVSQDQSSSKDSNQSKKSSQTEHQEEVKTESNDERKHEIEVPEKVEIESSDGKKVDITSVIQDIFGQVQSSKEETEKIQRKMENDQPDPKIALQEPSSSNEQEGSKQSEDSKIDQNNPPRTVEHGVMPMTASNDLHGVLIGLGMALVGIIYVLFRKGEQA